MQPRAAVLAVALTLGTCPATAGDESVFVEGLSCLGGRYGLAMPSDLRIVKKLSRALREDFGEVEQWDDYTATRKTLHFEGLELGVVEFSNDPARCMVTSAVLTSPTWNRLSPFKLRRPVSEAALILGDPAKPDPGLRRTYSGESDNVKIQSSGGIVIRVTYECYSG